MIKRIYLAGAMEAYKDTNEAKEWRDEVKEYFVDYCNNFECVSPLDYYSFEHNIAKRSAEIMRFDLRKVKESDVVLVNLKDIRKSVGSCDEILYAYLLGKPVIGFLEEEIGNRKELEQYVHSWKFEQIDRIETGYDALLNACEYIKDYYFYVLSMCKALSEVLFMYFSLYIDLERCIIFKDFRDESTEKWIDA